MEILDQSVDVIFYEDDPFVRQVVIAAFEGRTTFGGVPYSVSATGSRLEIESLIGKMPRHEALPFVLLVDLAIGNDRSAGFELIKDVRLKGINCVIIAFSDFDSAQSVMECLQAGADDFIAKQTESLDLVNRVSMIFAAVESRATQELPDILGTSMPHLSVTMKAISQRSKRIIHSAISSVLVYGESGTGKEVVADLFARTVGTTTPFFRFNCGAVSQHLLESELFGHVRGAFTGAISDRRGYFEAASGGWVFLDEIATLSASAQVSLLRVLENKELYRVGSSKSVRVDVRIIAATNESLEKLVNEGKFRRDLWQRLREVEIHLPPLRQRRDEISGLVDHFCKSMPGGPYHVTETVLDILENADWEDGNIRELRNCLRAMTEHATGDRLLTPMALPKWLWSRDSGASNTSSFESGSVETLPGDANGARTLRISELTVPISADSAESLNYDYICDAALVALVRKVIELKRKVSLRSLSSIIGLSRGTLTGRLIGAIDKGLVTAEELQKYFDIQDPKR